MEIQLKNCISLMTSSPVGDTFAMLPGLKQLYKETGRKCILYQRVNVRGVNHMGIPNAFQDKEGNDVLFSDRIFELVKPLLLAQDYIQDFIVFNGQQHDIAIDDLKTKIITNQPQNHLSRWVSYLVPDMNPNLSEKCISVKGVYPKNKKIYITITDRYRNIFINYFFLKKYEDRLWFMGLPKEHERFCREYELNIPLEENKDFLDIAEKLNACAFHLSNQTSLFQISEWLKIPRILEECLTWPNVIPIGENAVGFINQSVLELWVEKFSKL